MKIDVVVHLFQLGITIVEAQNRLTAKPYEYKPLPRRPSGETSDPDGGGIGDVSEADAANEVPRMVLLAKQHEEKASDWVSWCEDAFDTTGAPKSTATGCILLVRAEDDVGTDRLFAITFGTGWTALPREQLEPNFGLKVAMQMVPPDRVQSLVTKSLALRGSERNVYKHGGGELAQFSIDAESDWLRETGGPVDVGNAFSAVIGKGSVRLVGYSEGVEALPGTCAFLLAKYSAPVPEAFKFSQNLQPVPKHSPKHSELEKRLRARIQAEEFDDLAVVLSREDAELAHKRELKHRHLGVQLDTVIDVEVWSAVKELKAKCDEATMMACDSTGKEFKSELLRLRLLDADGKEFRNHPITDFLEAEFTDNDGVWLRMDGRWFQASLDYANQVDQLLKSEIIDLTSQLGLPTWDKKVHPKEEDYNNHVASTRGWLLQDCHLVTCQGQTIEPCDLLTPNREFLHVKEAGASQSVAALVGQVRSAAYMLKSDDGFRKEMGTRFISTFGSSNLLDERATFVAALGRSSSGLCGKMLGAKINVLDCARRVRAMGHEFAVCRVEVA
jgi:uncharacterized protein (TIGR04141 family)